MSGGRALHRYRYYRIDDNLQGDHDDENTV